ncbi:MAG: hypothetical protein K6B68_06720 [Eubacterium sp.]|nr:hypothetical protein [Eubacterium sp.]
MENTTNETNVNEIKGGEKKGKKSKGLLIVVWIMFVALIGLFGVFLYSRRKTLEEDLGGFTTRFSFQTNANQDINALIITYLSATASSDQAILKSCVTDPSQFDDMSVIQEQSKIITSYSNINCYSVEGKNPNETVVYAVANISIAGISSTPLDMLGPYYIVKDGNQYLIDNRELSPDIQKYMSKVEKDEDIQELYGTVKNDEDAKAAADPAFKEFLDKLNN